MNRKIMVGALAAAVLLGTGSIAWAANSDYAAWRKTAGTRAPAVTEANFDRFAEMHRLMAAGDYEAAAKLRAELGLGQGQGKGKGQGQGGRMMRNGGGFVDTNNNGICDHRENLK